MGLKPVLKSLEGLADTLKEFYKKQGEEYYLDVEDMVPKSKLDEYRTNNRELNRELTETKEKLKQYDGVDLEKWKEFQETERKIQDKKLIDAGRIDELLLSKIEPIKKEFQSQLDAAKQENQTLAAQLETMKIDDQLTKLATTKGIRPTAIEDMLARGRRVFKLQKGKVVALGQDGTPLLTKSGDTMTMESWIESLSVDAPHLFQPSTGGGAPPGNNTHKFPPGTKTMTRAEFDKLDPQAKMAFTLKERGKVID